MSSINPALICLTVAEKTVQAALERIEHDRSSIDLAEIRADYLTPDELKRIEAIPGLTDTPLLFTIRRANDGGKWKRSENERRQLLHSAAAAGYSYLDLESDVEFADVEQKCLESGTTIIRSLHDFEGIPDRLTDVVKKLPHRPDEIPKAAVTPLSTRDLISIVETSREL